MAPLDLKSSLKKANNNFAVAESSSEQESDNSKFELDKVDSEEDDLNWSSAGESEKNHQVMTIVKSLFTKNLTSKVKKQ